MKGRQRRLKAIELSLTPQQIVVVWLRDALQAGTFEEGARHSPPYRGAVSNAVFRAVRKSMKGQPEELIERAILQARQEADLLYGLAVNANLRVMENWSQREREYVFLLGYLSAEMHANPTKDRLQILRLMVLMFVKSVLILDAAITQVAAERLNGQPMLFRDSAVKLGEQLQMAERLSEHFNSLARAAGAAEINLEEHRNSLQSEIDNQVSVWINLARVEALGQFGTVEQMQAAQDPKLRIVSAYYDKNRFYIPTNQSLTRFAGDDGWLASLPVGTVVRHTSTVTLKLRRPAPAVPKFVSIEVPAGLSAVRLQPSASVPAAYLIILADVALNSSAR